MSLNCVGCAGATARPPRGRPGLAVGKGEFVCFLGPSGCGKTNTIDGRGLCHAHAGPHPAGSRGCVRLPPQWRPTCTVFQNYALFPHMTVLKKWSTASSSRRVAETGRARRRGHAGHDGPAPFATASDRPKRRRASRRGLAGPFSQAQGAPFGPSPEQPGARLASRCARRSRNCKPARLHHALRHLVLRRRWDWPTAWWS